MQRSTLIRAAGGAVGALLVIGVTTKDLGLVHGTVDPGAMYCTAYDAWTNDGEAVDIDDQGRIVAAETHHQTPAERARCIADFDALDLGSQRELLRNIGTDVDL